MIDEEKDIFVYDKPIIIEQKFEVHLNEPTKVFLINVIRREIIRQAHNTACDEADIHVHYDVNITDIDQAIRQKVIDEVEKSIEKDKQTKVKR
jgi:hypothetical protein